MAVGEGGGHRFRVDSAEDHRFVVLSEGCESTLAFQVEGGRLELILMSESWSFAVRSGLGLPDVKRVVPSVSDSVSFFLV